MPKTEDDRAWCPSIPVAGWRLSCVFPWPVVPTDDRDKLVTRLFLHSYRFWTGRAEEAKRFDSREDAQTLADDKTKYFREQLINVIKNFPDQPLPYYEVVWVYADGSLDTNPIKETTL